ncbi:hypothetical protein NPIL_55711 [Nephila pilipes]|uniref:Uncharacterized protein n=1 Tax=Nephila pilipes TaxID=299642 RepID=A0A8X6QIY6_NEPPI|nr:hypothetical protein NPIL_55711 [Nephila pilipes]
MNSFRSEGGGRVSHISHTLDITSALQRRFSVLPSAASPQVDASGVAPTAPLSAARCESRHERTTQSIPVTTLVCGQRIISDNRSRVISRLHFLVRCE